MALNSSGPISLAGTTAGQSIEIENGGNGTTQISLNDTAVRNLAGVPSGAITMPTNFWGKSNTTYFIGSTNNYRDSFWTQDGSGYYWLMGQLYTSGRDGFIVIDGATGAFVDGQYYNTTSYGFSSTGTMYNSTSAKITGIGYRSYFITPSTRVTSGATAFTQSFSCVATSTFSNGDYFSTGTYSYYCCGYVYNAGYTINASSGGQKYYGKLSSTAQTYFRGATARSTTGWASGFSTGNGTAVVATFSSGGVALNSVEFKAATTSGSTYNNGGIATDSSNNCYVSSIATSNNTGSVVKLNSSLGAVWVTNISNVNYVGGVAVDSSSNVYAYFRTTNTGDAGLLIKLNSSGVLQWQRTITVTRNGSASMVYEPNNGGGMFISSDGALVVSVVNDQAYNGSKPAILKLPTDGSKTGTYSYTRGDVWAWTYAASSYTISSPTSIASITGGWWVDGPNVTASTQYFNPFSTTSITGWGYTVL